MSDRVIRIAINGFGRIGRSILRMLHGAGHGVRAGTFEVVLINDIAPLESCAYLFAYDSIFGPFPGTVDMKSGVLMWTVCATRFTRRPIFVR